ncbi:hypothetical protein EIP86_003738 [Pleurotus ostreatoroseus]|nr:hypothetical protein EIP86_003738 [Pleurotus ostreatoroseus]
MSYVTIRQPVLNLPDANHLVSLTFSSHDSDILLDGWDDPELLRHFLAFQTTIPEVIDPQLESATYFMMNRRVQMLEHIQAQSVPHTGRACAVELAAARFHRKLQGFRVIPMHKFPQEILCRIFQLATFADVSPYDSSFILQRTRIASVCTHWRAVAFNDAVLWSKVTFKPNTHYWSEAEQALALSGSCTPLSVTLTDIGLGSAYWSKHFFEIRHLLVAESRAFRIHSFYARFDRWENVTSVVESLVPLLGPQLRNFDISYHNPRDELTAILVGPFLKFGANATLPPLRRLVVEKVACDWDYINLEQLTSLELRGSVANWPSVSQLASVLRSCTHLRTLSLADIQLPGWDIEDILPAQLDRLDEFSLRNCSAHIATEIISQFQAPNLRGLVLSCIDDNELLLVDWLTSTKRFPRVQDLALLEIHFEAGDVDEINDESIAYRRAKDLLTNWFLTLPQLRLLKLAKIHHVTLDALATPLSAETGSDTVDDFRKSETVCPMLGALHVDSMDAKRVACFIRAREALACPIKKAFVGKDWWPQLAHSDKRELALTGVPWYASKTWPAEEYITEAEHEEAMRDV